VYCREWRKRNKEQRESGQLSLFAPDLQPWDRLGNLAAGMTQLDAVGDDTLAGVKRQQELYEQLVRSSDYRFGQLLADAWCAAFVWIKTDDFAYPITWEIMHQIELNPFNISKWMEEEIGRLQGQYQFFHWHLAFPHVFRPAQTRVPTDVIGWEGGFDVVLGNPPWEHTELKEKEWFASRDPATAAAPNKAARQKLIGALEKENPALYSDFLNAKRQAEGGSHLASNTDHYPLCGRGDVNTYALFAELARQVQGPAGRVGIIVPSGIATDDTTKYYFRELMDGAALVSLYDFENREAIFPGVHRSCKFCLLTLTGPERPAPAAEFVFFAYQVTDLGEPERNFTLDAAEIALLNPNTRTCPIFRSRRDAELTKA
ncbi:MAG: Eco57I restriction-modification methylase domain-containing protein, partial [Anaerolineales bacterium]|nr:Eco57I restriction-modification methylase domain-containing protein [Anaerolineales bacterium]